MKNPQNNSIFLTKEDLEKISLKTNLTREPGSGILAYKIINDALSVQSSAEETPKNKDLSPPTP